MWNITSTTVYHNARKPENYTYTIIPPPKKKNKKKQTNPPHTMYTSYINIHIPLNCKRYHGTVHWYFINHPVCISRDHSTNVIWMMYNIQILYIHIYTYTCIYIHTHTYTCRRYIAPFINSKRVHNVTLHAFIIIWHV